MLRGAHAPCWPPVVTGSNGRGAAVGAGRAATAETQSLVAAVGRCSRLLKGCLWWPTLRAPECGSLVHGLCPGPSGGDSGGPGRVALPLGRVGMRRWRAEPPPPVSACGSRSGTRGGGEPSPTPPNYEPRQRRRSGPRLDLRLRDRKPQLRSQPGSPGLTGCWASSADAAQGKATRAEETAPGAPARLPAPPLSRLGRSCGPGGRRRRPARRGGQRSACQATGTARLGPRAALDEEALPPGPCSRRRSPTSSSAKRTVRNGGDCWSRPWGRSVLASRGHGGWGKWRGGCGHCGLSPAAGWRGAGPAAPPTF